jgi:hypothetical protein
VLVSLPPVEDPDLPAALEFELSPERGGASPGCRALDGSDVVVVDLMTVELVARARVVAAVVLLVAALVVVVDDLPVAVVDEPGPAVLLVEPPAPVTTTTPVIPDTILHR